MQLLKKRVELCKEQTADLKKYSVEGDLATYKDMFKRKSGTISSSEKATSEDIERREIVLFNLTIKIRDLYFKRCRENTRFVLKEFSKAFALFHKASEKVATILTQLMGSYCDFIKVTNIHMVDMKQGEVCVNPADHKTTSD